LTSLYDVIGGVMARRKTSKLTPTKLSDGVSYKESNLQGKMILHLKSRPYFTI